MRKWFGRNRLAKALCVIAPVTVLLAGCSFTGFDPGMVAGGRCFATPYDPKDPKTINNFEYKPDCPQFAGANLGFTPNHWGLVVFKDGYPSNALQQGQIGLTDNTVSPAQKVGTLGSPFQVTLSPDGKGMDVEMHLKPTAVNQKGGHVDFNLVNQATNGVEGLVSHHEVWMKGNTGKYQTSYVLYFTAGNWANAPHYSVTFVLAHTQPGKAGEPAGVLWDDVTQDANGTYTYYATVDGTNPYFGVPDISKGWTTVDIDWQKVIDFVQPRVGSWLNVNVHAAQHTQVGESFYASAFGPKGTTLGGVDVVQRNWTMTYK